MEYQPTNPDLNVKHKEKQIQREVESIIAGVEPSKAGFLNLLEQIKTSSEERISDVIIELLENDEHYCAYFQIPLRDFHNTEIEESLEGYVNESGQAYYFIQQYLKREIEYIDQSEDHTKAHKRYASKKDYPLTIDNLSDIQEEQSFYADAGYSWSAQTVTYYLTHSKRYAADGWRYVSRAIEALPAMNEDEYSALATLSIDFMIRAEQPFFAYRNIIAENTPVFVDMLIQRLQQEQNPFIQRRYREILGHIDRYISPAQEIPIQNNAIEWAGHTVQLKKTDETELAGKSFTQVSYYGDVATVGEERELQELGNMTQMTIGQDSSVSTSQLSLDVHTLQERDLLYTHDAVDIDQVRRDILLDKFKTEYTTMLDPEHIEKELGLNIKELTIREQAYLVLLLNEGGQEQKDKLHAIRVAVNTEAVRLALQLYIQEGNVDTLYNLIKTTGRYTMEFITDYAVQALNQAQRQGMILHEQLKQHYPQNPINPDECIRLYALHITQSLHDVGQYAETQFNLESWGNTVDVFVERLQHIQKENHVAIVAFRELIGLSQKGSLDLRSYAHNQQMLVEMMTQNSTVQTEVLQFLADSRLLHPTPEVHWRTNRTAEEYAPRVGMNMEKLSEYLKAKQHPIVLEFGPGSGSAKYERQQSANAVEFSLANRLYYSLGEYVQNQIQFDELERDTQVQLSQEDRDLISDILYKLMVINPGEEEQNTFGYRTDVQEQLVNDPRTIRQHIVGAIDRLQTARMVPSTISQHTEEGTLYPNKIVLHPERIADEQPKNKYQYISPEVHTALQHLLQHPDMYMNQDDPLKTIPIHPEGMMLGDFSAIQQLQENQVDFAIGVRSTVFLRGPNWVRFGGEVARVLTDGGMWVDDSLRDNDGYRYRIAEAIALQNSFASEQNIQLHIVLGPGFANEDHNTNDPVPLAIVMTKGAVIPGQLEGLMMPGYTLHTIDAVANNNEYLHSLTQNGELEQEVQWARAA